MQDETPPATRKKPTFPIGDGLRGYLRAFRRERDLPVTYERLRGFTEVHPARGRRRQADPLGHGDLRRRRDARPQRGPQGGVRPHQGRRRHVGRPAPLRGPSGLLHVRELDAVQDPDRERVQRQPGLLLHQEGRRLAGLRPRARAPAFAQPPQLHHARQHARRGAHRGHPGGHLHHSLAAAARTQPRAGRQGARQVQRAVLRAAPGGHALLQLRLRRDAGLRGLPAQDPGDGLRPAELQRPEELLSARSSSRRTRRLSSSARSTCAPRPPTSTSARSRR